ncbi:DUF6777 domain-containing protein [Streptomyces sp. NPDC020898]|uniref:DUF6777 domain-containing protein n=1 Tax=Streptomyces sp. NPDC020898 TaxID=3365101 RepID=UPI0037A89488
MSVEQPSSGRPTGPPSGPLSGPSRPPAGPPSQPPADGGGGSGGGGGGGEGDSGGGSGTGPGPDRDHPWWRSAPRIAVLATSVVAAVALIVVLTRSDGTSSNPAGGEVFLQAANKSGPDPFTESTAKDSSAPPAATATPSQPAAPNAVRGVDGGAPGLYGGTRKAASCDVEKQIRVLRAAPAKNSAFASVLGVQPAGVPAYLRSLTPVQLRMDTRVTNHGYRDGAATTYQAVLQTGSAVLVDDRGRPRVRCACGNPLTDPVRLESVPRQKGDAWPSYRSSNVVVVAPAVTVVNIFVVYDPDRGDWFHRHKGDTGGKDQKSDPPVDAPTPSVDAPTPSVSSSAPSAPSSEVTSESPGAELSPLPCVSAPTASSGAPVPPASPVTPDTASPSAPPCPPTSSAPASSSSSAPALQPPPSEPAPPESQPDDGTSDSTSQSASTYTDPESTAISPSY